MVLPSGKIPKCLEEVCKEYGLTKSHVAQGFFTKCFALYPHTKCQMWDPNEEEKDNSEVLGRRA